MLKKNKDGTYRVVLTEAELAALRKALRPSLGSEVFGVIAAGIASWLVIVGTAKLIGL